MKQLIAESDLESEYSDLHSHGISRWTCLSPLRQLRGWGSCVRAAELKGTGGDVLDGAEQHGHDLITSARTIPKQQVALVRFKSKLIRQLNSDKVHFSMAVVCIMLQL